MEKNIFDNETFFKGYMEIRKGKSYNELLESPAMEKLLPDLVGKNILDLGCGFGENAFKFVQKGANKVVGLDISEKMLQLAKEKYSHKNIEYYKRDMTEIDEFKEEFDLVYSSLAFHYIEDFEKLIEKIYNSLKKDGVLLFSQEHPIFTADVNGYYLEDENGKANAYVMSNYNEQGIRVGEWLVKGVINYHRTFSCIITTLIKKGFTILDVVEPFPSEEAMKLNKNLEKERIKPSFLIIKVKK